MSVAQTDGVKKPKVELPKLVSRPVVQAEPDEPSAVVEILEPVKRVAKKVDAPLADKKNLADVISAWGDED